MPAHTPSAPGVMQASCAHRHRSGQARQSAFAPSSAVVVHRSGSRVHAACDESSTTAGFTDTFTSRSPAAPVGRLWSCTGGWPSVFVIHVNTIRSYGKHDTDVLSG